MIPYGTPYCILEAAGGLRRPGAGRLRIAGIDGLHGDAAGHRRTATGPHWPQSGRRRL